MTKRAIVFIFILFLLLTSASCYKPYIGRQVSGFNPHIRLYYYMESNHEYVIKTKYYDFAFTIKKVDADTPETYQMKGVVKYKWSGLFTEIDQCHFALMLLKKLNENYVVTDYISFMPSMDLTRPMEMRKQFACPAGFDAVMIIYKTIIKG